MTERTISDAREHINTIMTVRYILSFVGEAVGQARPMDPLTQDAHSGVFYILESVKNDLKSAGNALEDIFRYPSLAGTSLAPARGVDRAEVGVANRMSEAAGSQA